MFIEDFTDWELAHTSSYLRVARELVSLAQDGDCPIVVDPFAGGGAIPLEALRLGCDVVASDLNPVACLINQVVLSDIPQHRDEMMTELPDLIRRIKRTADESLRRFFPVDEDGGAPVAYLWARTVRCEQPNCGCEIPLIRSFWLAKKADRRIALRISIERRNEQPEPKFEIFNPESDDDVSGATISRAKATCPACRGVLPADRVKAQLQRVNGGACVQFSSETGQRVGGARLLAVARVFGDSTERRYRMATDRDYAIVRQAQDRVGDLLQQLVDGICPLPNEETPVGGGRGAGRAFSIHAYGMTRWCDMFTARQLLSVYTFCQTIATTVPPRFRAIVALLISKVIDLNNSLTEWRATGERPAHMLSRWALPMKWDFPEAVPLSDASGSLETAFSRTMHIVRGFVVAKKADAVAQAEAATALLPDASVAVWFTDPPYYDAIPYSDLSDFFFVWLKRALPGHPLLRDPDDPSNPLTPKRLEAVQDERRRDQNGKVKDKAFFERKMREAFSLGRRVLRDDGVGCVVFAHKTTEGWEALLGGLIAAGWVITASWPIATEMSSRLRARDSAALGTSVHLICRPRPNDASVGDWGDVLRELPARVQEWMDRLQEEGVRGADLVFACIGPALEIYSRYSKVVDAEEREIPLGGDPASRDPHQRGYLAYVWEIVGRSALERVLGTAESRARNGGAGALEEDARLTALFLWTLQSTAGESSAVADESEDEEGAAEGDDEEEESSSDDSKGFSLVFDVVRRFAQPLGIHLEEWEGRIIKTSKGVVRLIPVLKRGTQLFGEDGASLAADRIESTPSGPVQLNLFPSAAEAAPQPVRGRRRRGNNSAPDQALQTQRSATTLDRVHAAMLLQHSGRSNALRALLRDEIERGPDFVRLANALSALYPAGSDEKRLVDAMLLAVPR
jgi:hypothetical protein